MALTKRPMVLGFVPGSEALAARIAEAAGGTVAGGDAKSAVGSLFRDGTPIIGICAAGILIRLLAPHLADKHVEPPVIAVSRDGRHVVPLLGGHHGANALARRIADGIGAAAALTTASDSRFARGLDDPPPGYVLANPAAAKPTMAAVLSGSTFRLEGDMPWLAEAGYPLTPDGAFTIAATHRTDRINALVYHPRVLVAGVGCERGAPAGEIIALVEQTLADNRLAAASLAALATIDFKAAESGLVEAARHYDVPLRLFSAAELEAERARLPNPSALVEAETGTPGVAEAAAVKAGSLIVAKQKSARATCAIGLAPAPIDPAEFGRAPGVLHIVGIGPGDVPSRTAGAVAALDASTDWVGYGLYLDLIADLRLGQAEHRFPLGEEEVRVRHAIDLAAQGRTVALISSGDAQIYAMATLVFECLEGRRIQIETHPGISAFQAASAAAGALIGHDFCCVSLSDLLTPRAAILHRLNAAGEGDFVTALYNPRSGRRVELIVEARDIFLRHRPPQTPVIVARQLGRPEQKVEVTTLAAFDPETIDMLTIVMIGASSSRAIRRPDGRAAAYTPRGYDRKPGTALEGQPDRPERGAV